MSDSEKDDVSVISYAAELLPAFKDYMYDFRTRENFAYDYAIELHGLASQFIQDDLEILVDNRAKIVTLNCTMPIKPSKENSLRIELFLDRLTYITSCRMTGKLDDAEHCLERLMAGG